VHQIGTSHPAVRQALALQRNQPVDDQRPLTVIEGLWPHQSVAAAGLAVDTFLYCPEALRGPEAQQLATQIGDRAGARYEISTRTLQRLSDRDRPDGLVSILELPSHAPGSLHLGENALVLVADGIEQPGNLGTLLRTLDACGADALLLTDIRTKPTNTKVFRASHGTVLTVPIVTFAERATALEWLAANGFRIYLADTEAAARYTDVGFAPRTALVLGNERYGIGPDWYVESAQRVQIPMLGVADSLNVSISAAVLLYAARAQLSVWTPTSTG
jgi:TrmH family RNA methyltransferase